MNLWIMWHIFIIRQENVFISLFSCEFHKVNKTKNKNKFEWKYLLLEDNYVYSEREQKRIWFRED